MGNTQLEDGVPTSRRLREVLRRHDVSGERAIALAQGAIALFILTLHAIAQISQRLDVPGADSGPFAGPWVSPWVVLILSLLVASSALRLYLVETGRPPSACSMCSTWPTSPSSSP